MVRDKLLTWCREQDLVRPGDRIILAVSGGADSMAMLQFFASQAPAWDASLLCAHFHHGLRGQEADRDLAFVENACRKLGVAFTAGRADVAALAKQRGQSLELAARQARYDFLLSLDPAAKVATAHTASDNGETVLLNLLRGASLQGLAGIPPKRGRIIRPMLCLSREEILDYLRQTGTDFVEDATNQEDFCRRNRLRHHVMPLLQQENPAFLRQLTDRSLRLRQDAAYLDRQAAGALEACLDGEALDLGRLKVQDPAISSRVLLLWLRRGGCREAALCHVEALERLASSGSPSAKAVLPGGLTAAREYGRLTLSAVPAGTAGLKDAASPAGSAHRQEPLSPTALPLPGQLRLGPWRVEALPVKKLAKPENSPYSFCLSYDIIGQINLLRSRQPGDRLRRAGGSKALSRLLIDAKIPRALRDSLPVLVSGGRVIAAAGIGADPGFLARQGQPAWKILIDREDESV